MFFSLSTTASDDPLMLGSSLHRKLFLLGSKWGTQHHVFMVLWSGGLSRGTMLTPGRKLNKERPSRMCLQTPIHNRAEKVVKKIEDPTAPAMRAPMYQVLNHTPLSWHASILGCVIILTLTVRCWAAGRITENQPWHGRERGQEGRRPLLQVEGRLCGVHGPRPGQCWRHEEGAAWQTFPQRHISVLLWLCSSPNQARLEGAGFFLKVTSKS